MKTKASLYTNLSRLEHSLSHTRRKKIYIPYSFREDTGCSENTGSFLNQEAQLRGLQTFRAAKNKGGAISQLNRKFDTVRKIKFMSLFLAFKVSSSFPPSQRPLTN